MDEFERLRRLLDDVPSPDPARKAAARRDLLALTRAEAEAQAPPQGRARGDDEPGVITWLATAARRPVLAAAAIVLVVLIAGGVVSMLSEPEPDPMADAPAPEAEEEPPEDAPTPPTLARGCTDEQGRYSISYPEGWQSEDCAFFGEAPLDIDEAVGGGGALAPIEIWIREEPFDVAKEPPLGQREVSAEVTTIDGRDAVRATWETTDENPTLPEGIRSYVYLVDLDGETLIAETQEDDDEHREILDEMMARIDL